MKKIICIIAMMSLSFLSRVSFAETANVQPLNSIAAVVNHEIITETQLNKAVSEMKQRWESQNMPLPDENTIRVQVLHQMILQRLQLQLAKQAKVSVSNAEVNRAIETIAKQNQISVPALLQKIRQERMNISQFREQIKKELLINKIEQMAVGGMIQITDAQVDQAYRAASAKDSASAVQYHVRDLLIALPSNPTPGQIQTANTQAKNILDKLKQGANFSELARAVSNDNNAMSGGDLGWKKLDALPDIFADRVAHMKVGESVGPISAPNGLHILKLEGIKNGKANVTKDQIRQQLFQEQFMAKLQTWLDQLQKGAYIKIFDSAQ